MATVALEVIGGYCLRLIRVELVLLLLFFENVEYLSEILLILALLVA